MTHKHHFRQAVTRASQTYTMRSKLLLCSWFYAIVFTKECHTSISHKQNFTHWIVLRLRYHTRLHTMLPPCYSQLVLCTVIHSPCVPHYTIGSWFYAIVFFNHVHNPMDHDTNIMRSKLH